MAVVATEVLNLTKDSAKETEEISIILRGIFSKVIELENQLEVGQLDFQKSEEAAQKADSIFQLIYQNAMKVFNQAETVKEKSNFLQTSSDIIVNEVTSISNVTEEASATTRQIYSGVEGQRLSVQGVIDSLTELNQLILNLEQLVNSDETEASNEETEAQATSVQNLNNALV